uniref:Putative salivary secreted peptide n=1 Tax=Ixodes pacificus TaxID=29930 RepID=Q6B875_IXOPA|nr:putative salivary secreted peptide [Ixodes pacificus]
MIDFFFLLFQVSFSFFSFLSFSVFLFLFLTSLQYTEKTDQRANLQKL